MADKLHAFFNPGILDTIGTVKLQFTKPRNAKKVRINLFEVDAWTLNGQTFSEGGTRDLIALITGELQDGKLTKIGGQLFNVPQHQVLFTVDLDGTDFKVPLPAAQSEPDLGFFEISFEITAEVDGAPEEYKSPVPLFMRNTPTPRAEIAFIAGRVDDFQEASTRRFFPKATSFWSRLRDNSRDVVSLQNIMIALRDGDDDASVRKRNSLPWGRVNIVSHGNDNQWFIRSRESDRDHFDFDAANLPTTDLGVPAPRPQELDEKSLIILRACQLGNDQRLLNAIRDKFGGRSTVFAPRHALVYRDRDGATRETLFEEWFFTLPGQPRFPSNPQLTQILKAKYAGTPLYGGFTDAEWAAVTRIISTDSAADAFRATELFRKAQNANNVKGFSEDQVKQVSATGKPVKSQSDLTQLMRRFLPSSVSIPDTLGRDSEIENAAEFDRFAWTWTVTREPVPAPAPSPPDPPTFIVSGVGVRTEYSIVRLILETVAGSKVPAVPNVAAVPNINNPFHFGRSAPVPRP